MKQRRRRPRGDDESVGRDRLDEDRHDDAQPDGDRPRRRRPSTPPARRRRRLPWFVLFMLVVLALLPTIVAKTPLRNTLLSAAMPTGALRVSVGDASLGWFTPPMFSQVRVMDAAGDTLITAEDIRLDRSPGRLLLDPHNLGRLEITRPTLYLQVRADGSNLEDVLRQALADMAPEDGTAPPSGAKSAPVELAVRLLDGTILAEDAASGRRWRVDALDIEYETADAGVGRVAAAGRITDLAADNSIAGPPGQFAVSIQPDGTGKEQFTLQAQALSLGLAEVALRQFVSGVELRGVLSGQGTGQWTAGTANIPNDLTTSGTLTMERLDVSAPLLAGDRLRLERVELPWRITADAGTVRVEDLQLRSDAGQVAVRGTIDPATMSAAANGAAVADIAARQDLELRGTLDLARLAAMLPHALRIRSDTTITSGTVQLAARAQPVDGGQLIAGSLQTTQLAATSAGRPFRWDQPVSASFTLRRQQGALQLDALKCVSDFLQVDARGTAEQMSANLEFDLNRLAEQLGQFIDLQGVVLAGTGKAKLDWQSAPTDHSTAMASGELAQVQIAWGETQAAVGQSNFTARLGLGETIDATDVKLIAGDCRVSRPGWSIREPRAELAGDVHWSRTTGALAANSVQLVTSTVSLVVRDVNYLDRQLTGMAAFRADLARLAAWKAASQPAPAYRPSGELEGNLRFVQQGDRLAAELAARGVNVALAQRTTADVPTNRGAPAPVTAAQAGYQTIWQEPQVTVRGRATYERASERLAFEGLQVQSNTLQADAAGQVDRLATTADVQLRGTLNYDLAQITPLLRPYVGQGIQLSGREQARFALAGAIKSDAALAAQQVGFATQSTSRNSPSAIAVPRTLRAQLELPWSGANVYGLPIGPGKLAAALDDGVIRVEPLALAVGEGRLTAAPTVRLDPPPAECTLPAGPLLTNVRISPEVSEAMLKYVAPVLAGATRSEGIFSMALDGARVPLGQPKRADAAGQMTVHSVRVVPGPLAQQWVALAQQIESLAKRRDPAAQSNRQQVTLLSVNDQQVKFRVVDGRVYHQNMEFQVGDVVLRSQGSVGFDETLALTLNVPIQDKWVASEPLLAGLRGRSLEIPISGTLSRPQMDQRAIAGLTQQLLQGAAQSAIGGELNKALDKLFNKR